MGLYQSCWKHVHRPNYNSYFRAASSLHGGVSKLLGFGVESFEPHSLLPALFMTPVRKPRSLSAVFVTFRTVGL